METDRNDNKKKKEELELKKQQLLDIVENYKKEIVTAKKEADEAIKESLRQIGIMQDEFKQKERLLREDLKRQIEDALREHLEFADKMKAELKQVRELGEEKCFDWEQKYTELNDIFENRPSRPEDLEMIQHLSTDNIQKEEALKKAVEDLKFYKLELVNREENFNKMFGANPNVGVFNPLQKKNQNGPVQTGPLSQQPRASGAGIGLVAKKAGKQ